ncbi:MAG: extracellular solute-binding protein [Spirochaetes bacterium]|nr:extracellular solute-binding protein [Spirochaetota bacterium]
MFKKTLIAVITIAILAGITGCGKSTDSSEKVLKIWHYESETGAMGKAWDAAIKKFQEKYPDVEVQFERKGFEQIRQTAQMVLNSDEAPDVMEFNKGNASSGMLSKQGLLADLTEIAKKKGWDKLLSPSLQTTCRYSADGIMGSGNWYGVTNYGEYVMVYYNKEMFAKYNLQIPKSIEEFETVMAAFKKAGVTPMTLAGAEYPAQQVFYELVLNKADRDFVNAYELYTKDIDFKNPAFIDGAEKMKNWIDKGYIDKNAVSLKAEDMGLAFSKGKSPIFVSGSWWYGRFVEEIGFDWGIFLFPGNKLHPGSGGNVWVVPEKAKNKKMAYEFIDITMSPEIQSILGKEGGIPVNADLSMIEDAKLKELISNFDQIVKSDGLAFYPDWPAAGFYDTLVAGVQELLSGSKTPEKFLESIGASYYENK